MSLPLSQFTKLPSRMALSLGDSGVMLAHKLGTMTICVSSRKLSVIAY